MSPLQLSTVEYWLTVIDVISDDFENTFEDFSRDIESDGDGGES